MAQFSEGLAGSSLNAGNYDASRKRAETILFRPLWRFSAAALESILRRPNETARLTPDTSDIAFLRDDAAAVSTMRSRDARTIRTLIDAGFTPESAVEAVTSGNWEKLDHTGLFSVQLQPAGNKDPSNVISVTPEAVAAMLNAGWEPAPAPE
jgi:hypothetical protein